MSFLGDAWNAITGKNQANGAKDVDPYKTDPNAYNYGGTPGGAQKQAGIYGNVANNYTKGAYQNFTAAGNALGDAHAARDEQMQALALAKGRAQGNNLISSQITAQQQQQAAAQQAGLAGSARGPAALAMAQQERAANTGQATAHLGAQGAIAGAQEQLANEQEYARQIAGIRSGDVGTAGTAFAGGGTQGGLGATYAGLENNVNEAQLTAQMNHQAQDSANYNAAKGLSAQVGAGDAAGLRSTIGGIVNGVAGGGSLALGGSGGNPTPAAAHGGAIHGERPYLVGEEGRELVVPDKPGFVMTALQTAALLGAPPTHQQLLALHRGRACGGPMYARAEGGPMEPAPYTPNVGMSLGQPVAQPPPAIPPNPYAPSPSYGAIGAASAPSTWGGVQPTAAAQQDALERAELGAAVEKSLGYQYGENATRKDAKGVDRSIDSYNRSKLAGIDRNRAMGLYRTAKQTPDEVAEERRLRAVAGEQKGAPAKDQEQQKAAEAEAKDQEQQKAAEAEAKKPGEKPSIFGLIGGAAKDATADTHARTIGGTYSAPQLLALPARAFGGPMIGSGTGEDMNNPGGSMQLGSGGGSLDVMGSLKKTNAIDTQYLHHAGFTREDGGPVGGFDTKLSPAKEKEFQAWKAQYAPRDSGADYDLRGAFAAGVKPDAKSGHWPDTFKKPNHETFSDESKYASAAPFAAGHWDGDTHTPGLGRQAAAARDSLHSLALAFGRREDGGPISPRAREDGGSIIASAAEHGTRFLHHLASSIAHATEPEPIAIERKAPRAAVTEKNDTYMTGTGWADRAPSTATLQRPGPVEYAEKVTRARDDDKARARGGPMLARGRKRCA